MRTLALTLARAQPARAAVGACVHAGRGRRNLPCLAPSVPRSAPKVDGELCIPLNTLSCPRPEAPGLMLVRFHRKAEQALTDLSLRGAAPGSPTPPRRRGAPSPSASPPAALLSLRVSPQVLLLPAGIWIQPMKLLLPKVVRGPVCTHFQGWRRRKVRMPSACWAKGWETLVRRRDQSGLKATFDSLRVRCWGVAKELRFFLVKGVATH